MRRSTVRAFAFTRARAGADAGGSAGGGAVWGAGLRITGRSSIGEPRGGGAAFGSKSSTRGFLIVNQPVSQHRVGDRRLVFRIQVAHRFLHVVGVGEDGGVGDLHVEDVVPPDLARVGD